MVSRGWILQTFNSPCYRCYVSTGVKIISWTFHRPTWKGRAGSGAEQQITSYRTGARKQELHRFSQKQRMEEEQGRRWEESGGGGGLKSSPGMRSADRMHRWESAEPSGILCCPGNQSLSIKITFCSVHILSLSFLICKRFHLVLALILLSFPPSRPFSWKDKWQLVNVRRVKMMAYYFNILFTKIYVRLKCVIY